MRIINLWTFLVMKVLLINFPLSKSFALLNEFNSITYLLIAIDEFLEQYFDENLFINGCMDSFNIYSKNTTILFNVFTYSGKGINELGLEKECNRSNLSYFLITYDVLPEIFEQMEDDKEVYYFLNQTTFYTGVCFPRECDSFFRNSFNSKTFREKFIDTRAGNITDVQSLEGNFSLREFETNTKPEGSLMTSGAKFKLFVIFNVILAFLFIFSFIMGIIEIFIGLFYQKSNNLLVGRLTQVEALLQNDDEDLNSEEIFYQDKKSSKKKNENQKDTNNNIFASRPTDLDIKEDKKRCTFECVKNVIQKLSIHSNLVIITTTSSEYYNEEGFEVISFFRVILMLFISLNQNLVALIKIPGRDFANEQFYKSFWFSILKVSSFALDCWVYLDGLVMIYKFMLFLKKNLYEKAMTTPNILMFLKFYFKALPKIISSIVLMIYVNYLELFYIVFFSSNSLSRYYQIKIHREIYNTYLLKSLIPGYILYYSYSNAISNLFFMQYRFCLVLINEFYVFTFTLILLYIAFKLKSHIYDFLIFIFVIINFSLTFLSVRIGKSEEADVYTIYKVLFHPFSIRFPHVMFNHYFIGIFTGFVCFYFKDIISKSAIASDKSRYTPFYLCLLIMKFFDTLGSFSRSIIIAICFLLLAIFSMNFSFLVVINKQSLMMHTEWYTEFIQYYEKGFFLIVFSIIILLLVNETKETTFRHLVSSHLFSMFSRTGVCSLFFIQTMVYLCYCLFKFQLKFSYQNVFFISLGIFMLTIGWSILFVVIIEIPIRVLLKSLFNIINPPIKERESTVAKDIFDKRIEADDKEESSL